MKSQKLDEVLTEDFPYQAAIVGRGILYAGTKAILYGRYKTMKSMLCTMLGLCAADGRPWLGFETPLGGVPVLYVQLEIPKRMMQARLRTMASSFGDHRMEFNIWTKHFMKLDTAEGFKELADEVAEVRPQLLIIDPVYKVMKGDMLSANDIQNLLDNIDVLMGEFDGMSVVLVSHTRKGVWEEFGSDDLMGSVIFSAWADTVIKVERKDGKDLLVKFEIVRHATSDIEPVTVEVDSGLQLLPKKFEVGVQ